MKMTGIVNLSGIIDQYIDINMDKILLGYLESHSGFVEKSILQNQSILQLQNSNIDFWYNHIQSILGLMSVIGIVMFIASYSYIWYQAKVIINKIKDEKKKLEEDYSVLLQRTEVDLTTIKENNDFQILLMKGLSLKSNKKLEEALDLYDNMFSQQFIQQSNDKKYGVYKEIADTHYLIGESGDQIYENASNYYNAIENLDKAMNIYLKEEDEIFKYTLQDIYDRLISLEPDEQ